MVFNMNEDLFIYPNFILYIINHVKFVINLSDAIIQKIKSTIM